MKKLPLDLTQASRVLFSENNAPRTLPVCDHYAGNPKYFEKALGIRAEIGACFDITLDLEDGAALGNPQNPALWVVDALVDFEVRCGKQTRKPGVRLHPASHALFEVELKTLLHPSKPVPAYFMVPKPEHLQDAQNALHTMQSIAQAQGMRPPPVHFLIETHGALAHVQDIAALPEVESLSFGIMDFVSSHRTAIPKNALNSPGQFDHPLIRRAKLEISAACHRFGKVPSHNVTRQIREPEIAGLDAGRAKKELGYTRMWSIHPQQIVQIVSALLPTDAEVQEARQVLQAAQQADWGPIQLAGELHDRASYRYFFEVLNTRLPVNRLKED